MGIKEIIESTILLHGYKTVYIGRPYEVINSQFVHKQQVDKLESLMKEYAKQKCEEQRKLCASLTEERYHTDEDGEEWITEKPPSYDQILSAPEPKFD